jgi:peptide/nickel transport system substrate-binding protein
MFHTSSRSIALALVSQLLVGCAFGGSVGRTGAEASPVPSQPARTLAIANRGEPVSMAAKSLVSGGTSLGIPPNFFNATLDKVDTHENFHPELAEALPQLNTDTWRINPDGTMATTYHLRPNLTWHDGTPLVAADFVFAHKVYKTPELGQATTRPMAQMEEVLAPDDRTVVIHWNRPYADAAQLRDGFQALPRHILQADFQTMDSVAFTAHPYWILEYVGLGPYRMDRYEPGAFIEGSAFDGYVLGRP